MSQNLGQIVPNITIGTVTKGNDAQVINVGTGLNPIFNFTLPKGDPGSTDWDDITNKPSTFPPETHTHTKNQITDFPGTVTMTATLEDDTVKTFTIYGSENA